MNISTNNEITFGSVCSGIEAASVAWHPLGWRAAWVAEIEKFPSQVLAHHYPDVPNLGDMTTIGEQVRAGTVEAPRVLVGGTPCQAFSVAGLRNSLDDERGQLTLEYVRLLNDIEQVRRNAGLGGAIGVWENVPGVLNTKDNAFGCFLGALAGETEPIKPPAKRWGNAGYIASAERAIAWRVLDAQYFGVAQRRRRVFVVACSRDDICPREILFEFEGVRRDNPPSREAGQTVATAAGGGAGESGEGGEVAQTFCGNQAADVNATLQTTCHEYSRADNFTTIVIDRAAFNAGQNALYTPRISEDDTMPTLVAKGPHAVAIKGNIIDRHHKNGGNGIGVDDDDLMYTLTSADLHAVAFDTTQITSPQNGSNPQPGDPCHPLAAGAHPPAIIANTASFKPGNGAKAHGIGYEEEVAPTITAGSGGNATPAVVSTVGFSAKDSGGDAQPEIAPTLRAQNAASGNQNSSWMAAVAQGKETVAVGFDAYNNSVTGDIAKTLDTGSDYHHVPNVMVENANQPPTAFKVRSGSPEGGGKGYMGKEETAYTVKGVDDQRLFVDMQVRRLTPVECERLQGFPDGYTDIRFNDKDTPDGPRYKALGNSMAVPVMRFIGERITRLLNSPFDKTQ